jgi:hypothetical protein
MPTPAPKPERARRYPKLDPAPAKEILARYEASAPALALAQDGTSSEAFLDALLEAGQIEDALAFLAHALPRREALLWGSRCVRAALPPEPPPKITAALAAADAWIGGPSDERRRAAMTAAEAATYGTPAGCLALAVFFSEGSLAPPDCPPVPVGEWFCARTVAAAIHLSCLAKGPEEAGPAAQACAKLGLEVAVQPAPWDEPARGSTRTAAARS